MARSIRIRGWSSIAATAAATSVTLGCAADAASSGGEGGLGGKADMASATSSLVTATFGGAKLLAADADAIYYFQPALAGDYVARVALDDALDREVVTKVAACSPSAIAATTDQVVWLDCSDGVRLEGVSLDGRALDGAEVVGVTDVGALAETDGVFFFTSPVAPGEHQIHRFDPGTGDLTTYGAILDTLDIADGKARIAYAAGVDASEVEGALHVLVDEIAKTDAPEAVVSCFGDSIVGAVAVDHAGRTSATLECTFLFGYAAGTSDVALRVAYGAGAARGYDAAVFPGSTVFDMPISVLATDDAFYVSIDVNPLGLAGRIERWDVAPAAAAAPPSALGTLEATGTDMLDWADFEGNYTLDAATPGCAAEMEVATRVGGCLRFGVLGDICADASATIGLRPTAGPSFQSHYTHDRSAAQLDGNVATGSRVYVDVTTGTRTESALSARLDGDALEVLHVRSERKGSFVDETSIDETSCRYTR